MTTAPGQSELRVLRRPPARRIVREVLGLLMLLVGATATAGFLWALDPRAAGAVAAAAVAVVGYTMTTER